VALVSQMAALGLLMAWLLLNEAGHAWSRTGVRQVNVSKPSSNQVYGTARIPISCCCC